MYMYVYVLSFLFYARVYSRAYVCIFFIIIINYYAKVKKTNKEIKNYRLQVIVSKKKVSKLATVRARIKRRIHESARLALPNVGRIGIIFFLFYSLFIPLFL